MRVALARRSRRYPVRYRSLIADRNRRFLLHERPAGRIGPNTFEPSEQPIADIGNEEALVRVDWISLDPTNRTWINDTPTYLPPGPRAFANLLIQRATVQGFIVLDHLGRAAEAATEIAGLIAAGKHTLLETVVEGFEQLPTAINMLFDGKNVAKLVVKTNG
jgi:NADPH-dependent curcumin reductase CurA